MKYLSIFLTFQYTQKKAINLKKIVTLQHKSAEEALGQVYNRYGISYVKEEGKSFICCNFQFGWTPKYISFCIVSKTHGLSWDCLSKDGRRSISKLLDHLIEVNQKRDFGQSDTQYPDKSLKMSIWSWRETMPKGYRLLNEGEIIEETDMEYYDGNSNNFWSDIVSHYNIGKKVEMSSGIAIIHKNGERENIEGHPDPLICRKIKQ